MTIWFYVFLISREKSHISSRILEYFFFEKIEIFEVQYSVILRNFFGVLCFWRTFGHNLPPVLIFRHIALKISEYWTSRNRDFGVSLKNFSISKRGPVRGHVLLKKFLSAQYQKYTEIKN